MNEPQSATWAIDRTWIGSEACEVLIDGLEVMADIGALASEWGVPQPLRIRIVLEISPPGIDDLAHTVDYAAIRAEAVRLAGERTVLIETFARRLATKCLAFEPVLSADIRIEKPHALPDCIAGTRIRLARPPGHPMPSASSGGDPHRHDGYGETARR